AVSGLAGFEGGDAQAAADGGAGERAGHEGLADAGVGGGDEQAGGAHAPQTARIESRTPMTMRSISSSVIERGGIITTTLPSGRRITPRERRSTQTRAPMASLYS